MSITANALDLVHIPCPSCDEGQRDCGACMGTGIGRHGDPDTSHCVVCRGRGWHRCEPCEGLGRLTVDKEDAVCWDCGDAEGLQDARVHVGHGVLVAGCVCPDCARGYHLENGLLCPGKDG